MTLQNSQHHKLISAPEPPNRKSIFIQLSPFRLNHKKNYARIKFVYISINLRRRT